MVLQGPCGGGPGCPVVRRALAIGCLLILALGIQSWGTKEEKALVSTTRCSAGVCRIQPAAVFLYHYLHTSLLGGIWQCHSKISYLLVFRKEKSGQVQFGSGP